MTNQTQCEIYDTYTDTNIHHQQVRYYWANVDTPKRGKVLAELIAHHEGKGIVWKNIIFTKNTHYDTNPCIGIQATVYTIKNQVKVRISVSTPKEKPFIL